MATISYVLRDAYATNYLGAVISVGGSRSYNVGQGLIDGGGTVSPTGVITGGTITIDATDQPLVDALDGYAGVRRSGSSDVGVAAATTRTSFLVVTRREPVGPTTGYVPALQSDGTWVATPPSTLAGYTMLPVPRADGGADDIAAINSVIANAPAGTHFVKPRADVPYVAADQPLRLLAGRSYDFKCPPWLFTGIEPTASGGAGAAVRMAAGANLDHCVVTSAVLGTGSNPAPDGPLAVHNLLIDANRTAQTAGKGKGLAVATWGSAFGNVVVVNARGNGIEQPGSNGAGNAFLAANGNGYENSWLGHIKISNCGGYGFYSAPTWTDCTINGQFTASVIGLGGINIANGAGWQLKGNIHCWNIGTDGCQITGAYACDLDSIYVEGYGAAVTAGQSGSKNPWVYGAYSAGSTYSMYQLVVSGGSLYYSLQDGNTGHTPGAGGSETWWQTINNGATAVYGFAAWGLGQDRALSVRHGKVYLGHQSINPISGINYRNYLLQGPSSGQGYVNLDDCVAGNEYANGQTATAMALRVAKQAGGLNLAGVQIGGVGNPTFRKTGTFSQADSIDAGVTSWTAL